MTDDKRPAPDDAEVEAVIARFRAAVHDEARAVTVRADDVRAAIAALDAHRAPPADAPEAGEVERLAKRLERTPLYEGSGEDSDLGEEAAAMLGRLSAERDAERAARERAEAERDEALTPQKAARYLLDEVLQKTSTDATGLRARMINATLKVRVGGVTRWARWAFVNEAIRALAAKEPDR